MVVWVHVKWNRAIVHPITVISKWIFLAVMFPMVTIPHIIVLRLNISPPARPSQMAAQQSYKNNHQNHLQQQLQQQQQSLPMTFLSTNGGGNGSLTGSIIGSREIRQENGLPSLQSTTASVVSSSPNGSCSNQSTATHVVTATPASAVDPRFSAIYGNPYLRSSNSSLLPPPTAV
ncbi:Irregular chiasm C-roughest protein [Eumeta japonica]|uniref:Irregular chiasm C-roughest protein n=1 Tax=Eumeta variegata TaxID=151549 RepID=A0A4C1SRD9_EUMVA|nr:Irregular chiasm C-roughest protein [Eumeta japonica]